MVDQSVRTCHLFRVLLLSSFVSDILLLYVLSSFTFFSHPHNSSIALPSALSFSLSTPAWPLCLSRSTRLVSSFSISIFISSLLLSSFTRPILLDSRLRLFSLPRDSRHEKNERNEEREREKELYRVMSTREIKWGGISGNVCSGFRGGCRFFAPPYFIAN